MVHPCMRRKSPGKSRRRGGGWCDAWLVAGGAAGQRALHTATWVALQDEWT